MNIKKILYLAIALVASHQMYGMKRTFDLSNHSITLSTSSEIPICDDDTQSPPLKKIKISQPNQFFSEIKQEIFNFDSSAICSLLSLDEADHLTEKQKNDLHLMAKDLKKKTCVIEKNASEIIQTTDNQDIKTKFSYDSEIKNIRTITRHLYAFKFFPNLTFPYTIFTPSPTCIYNANDTRIKPNDYLKALIKNEQEKISVCCYHITLDDIAKALVHQKKKGVAVEVITNQTQKDKEPNSSATTILNDNGIQILSPQKQFEQMHHKFFIFKNNLLNKSLVWSGSYNLTPFSNSHSWDNATVSDHPRTIDQFQRHFDTVKKRSTPQFKTIAK